MSDDGFKRYCVIIQLKKDSDLVRVAESAPEIKSLFSRMSEGGLQQLCWSNDGQLFGYFIKTKRSLGAFHVAFDKSHATRNGDSFIIFEIGENFTGSGFSAAWTWLQHH